MTSAVMSNSVTAPDRSSSRESRKKRRKKNLLMSQARSEPSLRDARPESNSAWKTESQQRIYSSKLLQALRHVSATTRRGQAVRQAADRVLAATAKGKTRWSRALMRNRLKLSFMKRKRHVAGAVRNSTSARATRKSRGVSVGGGAVKLRKKNMPAVQKKTRVLGRLVPGCKKQSLPVILEEATDYIPALEMQVRAMSALAQLLSVNRLQPDN